MLHCVFVRRRSVENKRSPQVTAIRCKTEALCAAPTKAGYEQLAIGCGELLPIIDCGIQVSRNLIGIEVAHRFHRLALIGEGSASATIGSEAGKQVRCDRDVAGFGKFISQVLHPIGHAKDFVDYENDRTLVLRFRISDERLH